jgi:hypothetical protein
VDASGNVTFADLTPGTYVFGGGPPAKWTDTVVYCSQEGDPSTLVAPPLTPTGLSIMMPADFSGSIICDYYTIPEGAESPGHTPTPTPDGGDTPAPTPDAGGTENDGGVVTGLPDTGAGDASDSSAHIALYGLGVLVLGMAAIAVRRWATR